MKCLRVTKIIKEIKFERSGGSYKQEQVSRDNHSQNIWDWVCFSCEIAHCGKSLISASAGFFASIKKTLFWAGSLGPRLSFYEVCTLS